MLLILIIAIKSSFCQQISTNKYPILSVINGDTVAILSMKNVDSVNITYIELDKYKELYSISEEKNDTKDNIINNLDSVIIQKDKQLGYKDTIINSKDDIIDLQSKDIKKKQRTITWLKIKAGVFIVSTIVFIIL